MGLKMMQAWVQTGEFRWTKLDKELQFLEDDKLVTDPAKLKIVLEKERAKDSSITGIIEAAGSRIKLHDNGKFSGIIWGTKKRISGQWS
jgi:hypothetical protein